MVTRRNFIMSAAGSSLFPLAATAASARPNLRVGILSDVHVNERAAVPLRSAFEFFRMRKVDAVLIAGDLSTRGQIEELQLLAKIWLEIFPGDRLPDGSPVERLFITGNHDVDGHCFKPLTARKPLADAEADSFYFHREKFWRELFRIEYAPVVKREVKGYVFVLRNWHSRLTCSQLKSAGWEGYSAEPEKNPLPEWFDRHAGELPLDRPFFFCQHEPPAGTCSQDGVKALFDDGTAKRMLKDFPNALSLSGHSHYSVLNGSSIWQGEFTAVNCGSSCGYAFTPPGRENGHTGSGDWRRRPPMTMPPVDFTACQQGLLMEVFDDRIVFERRDWKYGLRLGGDWVVPLGNSAPRPYRPDCRSASAPAPEFAADAVVSVRRLADGKNRIGGTEAMIEVSFPPLNGLSGGGARAFDFEVEARWSGRDGSPRETSMRVYSPNALMAPQFDVKPAVCRFRADTFADSDGDGIAFSVTALNEWGRRSRPIKTVWKL